MPMHFVFNDTATTEIYTLSLHDALPISYKGSIAAPDQSGASLQELANIDQAAAEQAALKAVPGTIHEDRKSTRLNSSHANISYAVFCLKKQTSLHTNISATYFFLTHTTL